MALSDWTTGVNTAYEKGIEKGIEKGVEIIKRHLGGVSSVGISAAMNVPLEDVEGIIAQFKS